MTLLITLNSTKAEIAKYERS